MMMTVFRDLLILTSSHQSVDAYNIKDIVIVDRQSKMVWNVTFSMLLPIILIMGIVNWSVWSEDGPLALQAV